MGVCDRNISHGQNNGNPDLVCTKNVLKCWKFYYIVAPDGIEHFAPFTNSMSSAQ